MFVVKWSMVFIDDVNYNQFNRMKDAYSFIDSMLQRYDTSFDYDLYVNFDYLSDEEIEKLEKTWCK